MLKRKVFKCLGYTNTHEASDARVQSVSLLAHVFLSVPDVAHHLACFSALMFTPGVQELAQQQLLKQEIKSTELINCPQLISCP